MAKIRLPSGQFALVDGKDLARVSNYSWYLWVNPARPENRYVQAGDGKTTVKLHRVVMKAEKGQKIDHKNRNTLDCRRRNLRFADSAQNAWNQTVRKNNKSGYKGVHLHPQGWTAGICVRGVRYCLGYFNTPKKASLAYRRAAKKLHGDFACA